MNGVVPTNGSQYSFSGYEFKINFGLLVSVNNPNILSIGLSDVTATAYYPRIGGGRTEIGGGYLAYQDVPKYSDFNFTFPFAIEYDPNKDYDQTVLNDIADKCGLTGSEKQPINLYYDIKLTAQVLFIKVHPTISSSTTFDCPLNNGALNGFGEDSSSSDAVNNS
ncbi:hypothetical protein K501DRAFT_294418 [Backusella circina FSU 941]|nr:hypothetical protein K501DRAFT_294418 [Backusella circina FSU 941]